MGFRRAQPIVEIQESEPVSANGRWLQMGTQKTVEDAVCRRGMLF